MPAITKSEAVRIINRAKIPVDNPGQISAVLSHQNIPSGSLEEAALMFLRDSNWSRQPSQPDLPERRFPRSKTKRTPPGIRVPLCTPLAEFHRDHDDSDSD